MKLLRIFLAALVVGLLFVPAAEAAQWELESSAAVTFSHADRATAGFVAAASRSDRVHHDGTTAFRGQVANLTVLRREVTKVVYEDDAGDHLKTPSSAIPDELSFFGSATILANDEPTGSVAFTADRFEFAVADKLVVDASTVGPPLSGPAAPGPYRDDEEPAWNASGRFASISLDSIEGTIVGSFHLLLFRQSMQIWARGEASTLVSEVRDDAVGDLRVRHIIWYELTGIASDVHVFLSSANSLETFYAGNLDLSDVQTISVAAGNGHVGPRDADGASIWLEGVLFANVMPIDSPDSRLSVAVDGQLRAFSYGGGEIIGYSPHFALSATVAALVLAVVAGLWLRVLVARTAIGLYTKLRKDRLLNAPARDTIFKAIRQSPGIHFMELQKAVGALEGGTNPIGFGALAYHLGMMERFELITSKREGRYRRYFEGARMGADASRIALLQNMPNTLIARIVLESPGISQGDLHARVSAEYAMTRQALSYHLRRMIGKELLVTETSGRFIKYRPSDRLSNLASQAGRPTEALAAPVLVGRASLPADTSSPHHA